ncbi:MAG: histidine kinase [Clostridia bacterium]|nr:histidine kinase [Clostridia bacterium]
MNSVIDFLYISLFGAALLLSVVGLFLSAAIHSMERWNKRFFVSYFIVLMLCCISTLGEFIFNYYPASIQALLCTLFLESLLLSVPLPMLTFFLLHCCKESIRESKLLRAVLSIWGVYLVILVCALFTDGFTTITPDMNYSRGPLYPLQLVPVIVILLLNLAGVIKRRAQLSRKAFLILLVAMVPETVTLCIQVFIDIFPLIDISIVVSALAMYGFVLLDQIERDLHQQREIARQQREIAHERASVMVLQMRPHFIYNTLMSIYSLCNLDPQKARQVTLDFTNYLRKNFNAVASDSTIPFTAELEHTRAYLAVEQAQYEDMLAVDYDTPLLHFRLPPLTLQPIVENAVKHGMNPYSGPLCISIRTRETNAGCEITVENNGADFDLSSDSSEPHIALSNIRQRLQMMCDGELTITPRDGGTVVKVTIPLKKRDVKERIE